MKIHALTNTKPSRRSRALSSIGAAASATAALLLMAVTASAQTKTINPAVEIDETQLLAGHIPLKKVLESGGHFFSTPYTLEDGFGEGANGPRAAQRAFMFPALDGNGSNQMPFLRLNGLDSQSCFECHNSIGSDPSSRGGGAELRKHDGEGGGAGFAANAFINDQFPGGSTDTSKPDAAKSGWSPCPPTPTPSPVTSSSPPPSATPDTSPHLQLTKLVRNPPHAFGSGYTQQLAIEMTEDLHNLYDEAHTQAMSTTSHTATKELRTKGVSFGTFRTTYDSRSNNFTDDFSHVSGLATANGEPEGQPDLTVRPFQFKGIASTLRHFVRDALNFHFSIQAVEKTYDGHTEEDEDGDGVPNEISKGDVSALTVFVGMLRPPIQGKLSHSATLGKKIFLGKGKYGRGPNGSPIQSCASCHVPSLKLNDTHFYVEDPDSIAAEANATKEPASDHPAERKLYQMLSTSGPTPTPGRYMPTLVDPLPRAETTVNRMMRIRNFPPRAGVALPTPPGYYVDLTHPDVWASSHIGSLVYPRLPARHGSVKVPLFSDLKLHKMGDGLTDVAAQGTDTAGIYVPADTFLTRPLWGVADTGPWLHDGRAPTLLKAIELHDSTGSEAHEAIDVFNHMNNHEKRALVDFLLTLRLPKSP
jgi:hypothetical protein